MTEETCPNHKETIIYTYNNKSYCRNCLDDKFNAIEKLKEYYLKSPLE